MGQLANLSVFCHIRLHHCLFLRVNSYFNLDFEVIAVHLLTRLPIRFHLPCRLQTLLQGFQNLIYRLADHNYGRSLQILQYTAPFQCQLARYYHLEPQCLGLQ